MKTSFQKKILLPFLIVLFTTVIGNTLCAQQKGNVLLNSLTVAVNKVTHTIDVTISPAGDISNLLVVLGNSDGKVVFLDNQYFLKNGYQVAINTEGYEKGTYTLKITADNEKEEQTLIIK
jgi:hypothetical protein